MTPPLTVTQKSHLALVALVSALLIFKAARRAPKKTPLLKDLRDVTSKFDAGDVTSQQYDIIIVGGGEFPSSLSWPLSRR